MGSFFSTQSDENEYPDYDYVPPHEILVTPSQIEEIVTDLADRVSGNYAESNGLVLVCVLKGAVPFMTDLSRKIEVAHEVRYITAKSYLGTESTGTVDVKYTEPLNVAGKDVIIVDDIVDTGLTLKTLVQKIKDEENPRSVACCTLLEKGKHDDKVYVEYVGISIEDKFVFGYGLDVDEKYRHLPYIAAMVDGDDSSDSSDSSDSD